MLVEGVAVALVLPQGPTLFFFVVEAAPQLDPLLQGWPAYLDVAPVRLCSSSLIKGPSRLLPIEYRQRLSLLQRFSLHLN